MCQKGRALQLSAAAGSPQEKRSRRGRSECPCTRSRVQCSHRGGNGGASQFLLLHPTGALGQCLMRGTGGRSLRILAAKVSLGGGGGWGGSPRSSDCSHRYRREGGRRLCRGMCVLSLLRRNGFRMIQGRAGKRVCPLPPPAANLAF